MPRLTLTDYAKHRGCYPRAVEAAIAAGRIKRDPDGLIDQEQADRDWSAHTNPYKSAAASKPRKSPAAPPAKKAAAAAVTDMGEYTRARAQREHYQAELARLSLEEKQRKLIDREQWVSAEQAFWRGVSSEILSIADRVSDELAAETDAAKVRTILSAELRSTLERASAGKEQRRLAHGG